MRLPENPSSLIPRDPRCSCWTGVDTYESKHNSGVCKCPCLQCQSQRVRYANARATGTQFWECGWRCGRTRPATDTWVFVVAWHAKPLPKMIPICWHCWHLAEEYWPDGLGAVKYE
jgi:hypothetical protein